MTLSEQLDAAINDAYRNGKEEVRAALLRLRDGVKELEKSLEETQEQLKQAQIPICVGRPIIEILARDGQWISEDGRGVIAADCLFQKNPYKD